MDPTTLAALINGGSKVLGTALQTPPAGPSGAYQTANNGYDADFSGWLVNFGGGTIDSTSSKTKTDSNNLGPTGLASSLGTNWQTVALIGLGVVAVWAAMRR